MISPWIKNTILLLICALLANKGIALSDLYTDSFPSKHILSKVNTNQGDSDAVHFDSSRTHMGKQNIPGKLKREQVQILKKLNAQKNLNYLILLLLFFSLSLNVFILIMRKKDRKKYRHLDYANKEIHKQNEKLEKTNHNHSQLIEQLKKQRDQILRERNQLEENYSLAENKNWEIANSFHYASHIQSAILPDPELLSRYFEDHFILIRPKNVVSGDFYWFTEIEDKIIAAAVDCTGHGVAGGLMSMLGVNLLNEIVKNQKITSPDKILNEIRELIIEALEQRNNQATNLSGMDMSLIVYSPDKSLIEFAGANNPIYLVRNNKLEVFPSDKMPVALHSRMDDFTKKEIQVTKGDQVYLFSDGYSDQFGGEFQKKFKFRSFKKLIVENNDKPMGKQKALLNQTFESWKGELEQVDDVLVMGLKV